MQDNMRGLAVLHLNCAYQYDNNSNLFCAAWSSIVLKNINDYLVYKLQSQWGQTDPEGEKIITFKSLMKIIVYHAEGETTKRNIPTRD